jgi:hypothetical protein
LRTTVPLRAVSPSALFSITWMLCTDLGDKPLGLPLPSSPRRVLLSPLVSRVA